MTVCNYCNNREKRARIFTLTFTCKECERNKNIYLSESTDDEIIFINSSGKEIPIDTDTDLSIEIMQDEKDLLIRTSIIKDGETQTLRTDEILGK